MHPCLCVHKAPGVGADQGSGNFSVRSVSWKFPRRWSIRLCSAANHINWPGM